jgi:hypothetical protein
MTIIFIIYLLVDISIVNFKRYEYHKRNCHLPFSQHPATDTYPEPDESAPYPSIYI